MRRITVEEIRKAVAKTGLKLTTRRTLSIPGKCGCPIGILARAAGDREQYMSIFHAISSVGLEERYATGFVTGFDGGGREGDEGGSIYGLGIRDGLAARSLLPELGVRS